MDRSRFVPFVLLAALALVPVAAAQAPLEAYLDAPFRSGLVAAPSLDRIAWVEHVRGRRNLMVADGPDFTPRALTAYTEDDGQTLGNLLFSPDGATLVFTYGDSRNRHGEFPNPTHAAEAPVQRILAVDVDAPDSVRTLADGSGGTLAPDGTRLAFVRNGAVWTVPLDGSAEATQLFEARGGIADLAWSPDGARLAFSSRRGDHGFIGVYEPGAPAVRWLAPGVDRDQNPVWSPDGSRLAFYRFEGPQPDVAYTGFGPESEPYAVWVVQADGSNARELWRSPRDGRQGYPSLSGTRELAWADAETLVFPAEISDWTHLYAFPAAGGEARDLTPGACLVEDAALRDGWLYVNHNCDGLNRRTLARIRVADGTREALTEGSHRIDWAPTPLAGGTDVAFIGSTWQLPGAVQVVSTDGDSVRFVSGPPPEAFPAAALVRPDTVRIQSPDGLTIHAQLFLPPDSLAGPHPAVVYLHGGSRRQMMPAFHYSSYYHNAYAFNQYLASRGYVVLAVNYRSGIGYGKAFRQPPGYGWQGAAEYEDVLTAGQWLAARDDVDRARIGLWGGSYGGYLTAMGLARNSNVFAAGVDLHGVHNWATTLRFWGSELFDLTVPEQAEEAARLERLAFASSPNADVATWRSPVLFVHGDDDRNVDFAETLDLVRLLRAKGDVTFETLVLPDEVHGFLRHASWLRTFEVAAAFLDVHLAGGAAGETEEE